MSGNNEQITKFIKTTKRRNRGVFHCLKKIPLTKSGILFVIYKLLLKRQNFDVFKPHKYTVSCGDPDSSIK